MPGGIPTGLWLAGATPSPAQRARHRKEKREKKAAEREQKNRLSFGDSFALLAFNDLPRWAREENARRRRLAEAAAVQAEPVRVADTQPVASKAASEPASKGAQETPGSQASKVTSKHKAKVATNTGSKTAARSKHNKSVSGFQPAQEYIWPMTSELEPPHTVQNWIASQHIWNELYSKKGTSHNQFKPATEAGDLQQGFKPATVAEGEVEELGMAGFSGLFDDSKSQANASNTSKRARPKEGSNAAAKADPMPDPDAFTAEEDEQLMKLKDDGKSWNDIQAVLGKAKKVLQHRFRELSKNKKPAVSRDAKSPSRDAKSQAPAKTDQKAEGRPSKKDHTKDEEDAALQAEWEAGSFIDPGPGPGPYRGASSSRNRSNTRTEDQGLYGPDVVIVDLDEMTADDNFTKEDLHLIARIILQDDRQRWLRVASRFFDKTGKRVSGRTIRDKFENAYTPA